MPRLTPTEVTANTIGDTAFDGIRKRPILAINDEGKMVVCCRRTAKVNGWTVQGALHERERPAPMERVGKPAKVEIAADGQAKPRRRKTDHEETIVVPKATVESLKAVTAEVDAILGS